MSDQESSSIDTEEIKASKPRNPDGTFMSQAQINKLKEENKQLKKEAFEHLKERNHSLMQGTPFNEGYFEGMNNAQIHKFLTNYHKNKAEEPEGIPDKEPNTPILGTPVGSGERRYFLDKFLTIDPKEHTIDFEAPASIALAVKKNQKEAEQSWLDLR